ncbi:hypothetical protein ACHAWF_005885, partial [Thalassiosira exigua]
KPSSPSNSKIDWNSESEAHVLIYAKQGSWFGHQNDAEAWPYLVVNTTLRRPEHFHNRTTDGNNVPFDRKRASAVVPRNAFAPLPMKAGNTWSLYACASLPDLRYRIGTSLGKVVASSSELRVLEVGDAADWPQFHGGLPGVDYTFYVPRVFSGNLRYDYVHECPSDVPSAAPTVEPRSEAPSSVLRLEARANYTFYVEHASDRPEGAVKYDMSSRVRAALDRLLEGEEELLRWHAENDGLEIATVEARTVSPTVIGYLCYPTPPETCTSVSVDVTATHRSTATVEDITYALLSQSKLLSTLIDVDGYKITYVGDEAVNTTSEITLGGVPGREMAESEQELFTEVIQDFLDDQILSVTVNGQEITAEVASDAPSYSNAARKGSQRRLQGNSNNVQVSVKGKYRPPPELDFGEIVETSINRDRALLEKKLKDRESLPSAIQGGELAATSGYFEKVEVVNARATKKAAPNPSTLGIVIPEDQLKDQEMKKMLNMAAVGVGVTIGLLSVAFFLRPHRRRAIFRSSSKERAARRLTQPVDMDGQAGLLGEDRGWGGSDLYASGSTYSDGAEKHAGYDRRANESSEGMPEFSDFSHGAQPGGFDPRSRPDGSFARGEGAMRPW